MTHFELHEEFLIQPYSDGVKLVKPNNNESVLTRLADLFSMPILVYLVSDDAFMDANHLTRLTNIPGHNGYYSQLDLKKRKFLSCFDKDTVNFLAHNNNYVMQQARKMAIFEECCIRLDEISVQGISFKFPLYNDNKVIGIFGISALVNNSVFNEAEPLSIALQRIINTGLISRHYSSLMPGFEIDNIYLSKQEINCVRLLLLGKTMKAIGLQLGLSPRTVEHYLENIKRKLNVKTKADLIEKIVSHIWPEMLV